jgi:thioredoxin reductase (NADPH)
LSSTTRDIVIAGSGPAGYTAAIYAARAGKNPLLIEGLQPGGQLVITTDVENFPGFAEPVVGTELMDRMRAQAERVGAEIVADIVEEADLSARPFTVSLANGGKVQTRTFIVATGAEAGWLGLPSEEAFRGRGVSACATCDGFFFRDQRVAVVGGGDVACEEANYLTNHASEVILVHRRDRLRASDIMAGRTLQNPKIKPMWFRVVDEVLGDESGVTGVRLKDPRDGKTENIELSGVFIAIGHRPNSGFLAGQVEIDDRGYIVTTPGSTRTSVKGVFAAGDVQDSVFRQAVTAAATGCMAALEASRLLDEEG